MKRIEISVENLVAWQTNSTDYVCGNSEFVVGFVFDKEWNEFETKTARFIHGGEHTDIVFTGTECKVPKIFNVKKIEVGVFAGDLHTTTPASVKCRKSILCGAGTPTNPPPDVYNQIMNVQNDHANRIAALEKGGGGQLQEQMDELQKAVDDLLPLIEEIKKLLGIGDGEEDTTSTTAILGVAVLGEMVLGG